MCLQCFGMEHWSGPPVQGDSWVALLPSLVVEIAYSQSRLEAVTKAARWLSLYDFSVQ